MYYYFPIRLEKVPTITIVSCGITDIGTTNELNAVVDTARTTVDCIAFKITPKSSAITLTNGNAYNCVVGFTLS